MIVFFDTETTGLLLPKGAPLQNQPKIIEFAAIKTDENLEEIERIEFMVNPECPLSAIITKVTGLTDNDLIRELPFKHFAQDIANFFKGVTIVVAHNVNFDVGMLKNDMRMVEMYDQVDWGFKRICTVEATFHINNKRMNLAKAYKHFTGKDPEIKHRAMGDVESLLELTKCLIKESIICLSTSNSGQRVALNSALAQSPN